MKVSIGFDRHLLKKCDNSYITIAGVKILSSYKVVSHSDGDVVYHCIADIFASAFLSSSIGELYPDTDDKFKNMNSSYFVKDSYIKAGSPSIENIDIILVADYPLINAYREAMRENIAILLSLENDKVSIRGRRSEDGKEQVECLACILFS